jgi:hypothetical protein
MATYPSMNEKIVGFLRGTDPMKNYAADRIEELEARCRTMEAAVNNFLGRIPDLFYCPECGILSSVAMDINNPAFSSTCEDCGIERIHIKTADSIAVHFPTTNDPEDKDISNPL